MLIVQTPLVQLSNIFVGENHVIGSWYRMGLGWRKGPDIPCVLVLGLWSLHIVNSVDIASITAHALS